MKPFLLAIIAFALCACHSKKSVAVDSSTLMNDTAAVSAVKKSEFSKSSLSDFIAKCDSASVRIIADSITTPDGTIYRPSVVVAISAPSVSAVRQDSTHAVAVAFVDSVRNTERSATANELSQSETVAVTKPPDLTVWIIIACVFIFGLWFLRFKK